jgi:peptidoglycan/LPS O-acetylase OafA/YrhL
MSSGARLSYVPAIDGLRALAVLSVLIFHLGGLLPAGFVGVDVFFVISGYVVASAAKDLPASSFREFVIGFYARRLIRIAPALICCLLVSMAVMAFIVPVAPDGRLTEINTKTGLSAFWGFSNFVLAGSSNDYWSPRAELNPFTHTWSLAIEEQFYLLFPLIYFTWLKGRQGLAKIILLGAIAASLAIAIGFADQPVFSFYMLPTRFWELGLGVSIFFFRDALIRKVAASPKVGSEAFAAIAFATLLWSFFSTDSSRFPWPGVIIPVLAVGALLISILAQPNTYIGRLLAAQPLVQVGKVSYSLYLWHWPVVVFGRWTSGMETPGELLLAFLLSCALACLSYRFVESPIRYSKALAEVSRGRVVVAAAAVIGISFLSAVGIAVYRSSFSLSVTKDPLNWRWDGSLPSHKTECSTTRSRTSFGAGQILVVSPVDCVKNTRTLYVAGDSHANAYSALLDLYARESGARVQVYGMPGCGFFNLRRQISEESDDCQRFVLEVLKDLRNNAKSGDLLFMPGLRVARYLDQWGPGKLASNVAIDEVQDVLVTDEAVTLLKPLSDAGMQLILEAPKPVLKAPPFRCSDWFNRSNPICQKGLVVQRSEAEQHREVAMRRILVVAGHLPAADVWDPLPMLCPNGACGSPNEREPMLFDGDHISGFANRILAADFVEKYGSEK